jgi:RNA polymerase sigma factor (sigma-70 family)
MSATEPIMRELVTRAQGGDHEAFTVLMRAHESGVRSVCRRFVRDADDASDLTLETFVEAYLKLFQLRSPDSFGPWLRGIALNLCRTWYREQGNETVPLHPNPEPPEAGEGRDDRVMAGMEHLNAAHRRVLDLHYHAGLSYQEIADEVGIPIGTVMSRMHRARGALREIVETTEETGMDAHERLEQRFRMEIELLEALKVEVGVAHGIDKIKVHSEPLARLRQVVEHHPPRLVDLLRVSDSDEHLIHLAWMARSALGSVMPVLASCALSGDETLSDRATKMAEYWAVRSWYGLCGIDLFLDTLIASPAPVDRKVRVLICLMQAVKESGPRGEGHHLIWELTRVLLGYPDEAFPALWEALWQLDEDDLVEYGVRKAIAHLVDPLSDALIAEARSGDRDRVARLLREMTLVPCNPWQSVFREGIAPPERLLPVLLELVESEDAEIAKRARGLCVRFRIPAIAPVLRDRLRSGNPKDRADAAKELANAVGDEAIPDLIAGLNDSEARVRAAAMNALGQLEAVTAKDEILERLETDEDLAVREAAIKAYGKVASKPERDACLQRITKFGDRQAMKVAARALYEGTGPRKRTELEVQRIRRIRGDSKPEKHIDPVAALRALPELRSYGEAELTRIVAGVCGDYSTTRRQMVMEGRHALMKRAKGVYTFTQIGEAVWRVGEFSEAAKQRLSGKAEGT